MWSLLYLTVLCLVFPLGVVQARVVPDHRSEKNIKVFPAAGYPFGNAFSDAWAIGKTHRRIAEIDAMGCDPGEHITGMSIIYRDNTGDTDEVVAIHGEGNGEQVWRNFAFGHDEYIKEIRLTTWDKKVKQFRATVYHTRIGYMKITTSRNNVYECGGYDGGDPAWTWGGDGLAFLYFSGSQGDAMDQLQGHFIPVSDW